MGLTVESALPVAAFPDLDAVTEHAQLAESLGYAGISFGEVTGDNAIAVLTMVAERTRDLAISNSVFTPFSRSPTLIGQTAITMQKATDGRYRLALGTGTAALAESWHGRTWDRPLRRLRETIEIVRLVMSGERVDYDGEYFTPAGLRLTCDLPDAPPPIDVAALGPKATELTGRFADGWTPQLFTPHAFQERYTALERGASLGNRDASDIRTSFRVWCCALEDRDRARSLARSNLAFMIAAYGPYYRQSIADQGYEDVTSAVYEAWQTGDRAAAVAAVPDDVLDTFCAAGTPDEARETIREYAAIEGIDAIQIGFAGQQTPEEIKETTRALAPDTLA